MKSKLAAVLDRIDPENIRTLWYENEDGEKFYPNMKEYEPPPPGFNYQYSEDDSLHLSVLKIVQQDEVDECDHPVDFRKVDHGMDPAYGQGERCEKCGGDRELPAGAEKWSPWRANGSISVIGGNSGWAEDLALALGNSGIRLHKAIPIAARACERCMNSLAHEVGLDWGYPEMSDEWKKCGTVCEFCSDMGFNRISMEHDVVRKFELELMERLGQKTARSMEAYSYGCVMADLPDDIAKKVMAFAALIPDEDIYDDGSGEHGREDEPHVTVKYGLHTDDPKEVEAVLGNEPPVKIQLGGMSAFHNEKYVVLKLDVRSSDLHHLNSIVSNELECTDSFPDYHPHVTIAYLNHRKDDPYWYQKLYSRMFEGLHFEVDELRFSTADDKEYEIDLEGQMQKIASMAERIAVKFMR